MAYVSRVFHSSLEEHPNLQSEGDRLLFGAFGFFWVCSSHFLHNRAFVFFFLHRFLNSNRNFAHINLALSLILAELLFVLGIDKTQNQVRCSIVLFVFVVSFFSFFILFNSCLMNRPRIKCSLSRDMLFFVMSRYQFEVISPHVMSFGIMSRHLISLMSCYVMSCHPLCIVMWCHQLHVMSCLITLCLDMLGSCQVFALTPLAF